MRACRPPVESTRTALLPVQERAYLGAAHQLGWRVHCAPAKRRLLRLLGLPPEWLALLTDAPEEAQASGVAASAAAARVASVWFEACRLQLLSGSAAACAACCSSLPVSNGPSPPPPQVHVLGMGEQLHEQVLADRIAGTRWTRVLAVKPTGAQLAAGCPRRCAAGRWLAWLLAAPPCSHNALQREECRAGGTPALWQPPLTPQAGPSGPRPAWSGGPPAA